MRHPFILNMFIKRKTKIIHLQDVDSKKKKKRIIIYSIIGILVVIVCVAGYLAYNAYIALGKISENGFSLKQLINQTSGLKNTNGRINILLLGYGGKNHPGGTLTDTNILFSFDQNTGQFSMVSFPRDLKVTIPKGGGVNKLNYAYAYGEMNPYATGGGPEIAKETNKEISGQLIHYYVSIDFVGFRDLVNALGGVTVDVDKAINDQNYPADYFDSDGNYHKTNGYKPFVLSAGTQKMDGETALKYARSRYSTSDFDRSDRQQKIILAIKDKALTAGVLSNPKKIANILSILGSHIRTDISSNEYSAFINMIKKVSLNSINKLVIDNGSSGLLVTDNTTNGYYLVPKTGNFKQIQEAVARFFTSSKTSSIDTGGTSTASVSKATGDIEVSNASEVSGLARKVGEKLRTKGMTVPAVKTSSESLKTSVLYDYTGGNNPDAVSVIKQIIPTVQVIRRTDGPSGLDFKLVIGKDYSGD